jgi:hypothetical protein
VFLPWFHQNIERFPAKSFLYGQAIVFERIESKFLAVNNGWVTSTWMMALKALSQSVSVAAGLLLEDNFFHIKISQIDIRGGQKPIFTL